jgi:3-deoxy-manno-octulosonate cytidylyltransferase (CMP-KDO synthetase)
MKVIALIPARLQSTRLPNKLLLPLGEKSILATTYSNALATELFTDVIAICDDDLLAKEILNLNGKAFKSTKIHETGTDRIAEFAQQFNADIIINIQADEPFINKEILLKLIACFTDPIVEVASCRYQITEANDIQNSNHVKVICDENNFATLFSRSPIPFHRNANVTPQYYKHIGIYAFRPDALLKFTTLEPPLIEQAEQLENLRFIYYNIPVKMITIDEPMISIDTQEDYEKALGLIVN